MLALGPWVNPPKASAGSGTECLSIVFGAERSLSTLGFPFLPPEFHPVAVQSSLCGKTFSGAGDGLLASLLGGGDGLCLCLCVSASITCPAERP